MRADRGRALAAALAAALATAALVSACSTGSADTIIGSPEPSPSISTLTPIALPPPPPPTGKLLADMRQSSRDAAAGRMEVWIDNDTDTEIRPRRIIYSDPRFRTTLPGTRLRPIPSQSERGFPIYLPSRPTCERPHAQGTVTVTYGGTTRTVPVADETDVAGRYAAARCLELAVARVADLRWSDRVPWDGEEGSDSTLTLLVTPTGRPGPTLRIDTISGTPVLSPADGDVWRPRLVVHGTDEPQQVALPLKPTRCDAHAFAESGGATAFKINLRLDGAPGQITLRMSTAGAADAMRYAKNSCGDLLGEQH